MYRKPLTIDATLRRLKETEMATRLETVIAEGKVRTYDMGGKDSTLDVAKAIADYARLRKAAHETRELTRNFLGLDFFLA